MLLGFVVGLVAVALSVLGAPLVVVPLLLARRTAAPHRAPTAWIPVPLTRRVARTLPLGATIVPLAELGR